MKSSDIPTFLSHDSVHIRLHTGSSTNSAIEHVKVRNDIQGPPKYLRQRKPHQSAEHLTTFDQLGLPCISHITCIVFFTRYQTFDTESLCALQARYYLRAELRHLLHRFPPTNPEDPYRHTQAHTTVICYRTPACHSAAA